MSILREFSYHSPATVKEAASLMKRCKESVFLAGGTFVLNSLKKIPHSPGHVIGLKKIKDLRGIREASGEIVLGAMTTLSEAADSLLIARTFGSLRSVCRSMATTPIRNMATVGGNIASRFFWAELPAVLMSLGARISCVTDAGKKILSIEDFLKTRPAKKTLLVCVRLPKKNLLSRYFRHTETMPVDIPSAALAFAAQRQGRRLKDVRCVVNTTLSLPLYLQETQKRMESREVSALDHSFLRPALEQDLQNTKLDEYRKHLLANDIEEVLADLKKS